MPWDLAQIIIFHLQSDSRNGLAVPTAHPMRPIAKRLKRRS